MERVAALIFDNKAVLFKGHGPVEAWVETAPEGNELQWRGYFLAPEGALCPDSGRFLFATTDGRSGVIFITGVRGGSGQQTRVEFEGSGPLREE
jgi:hypothetical protein